jgi:hypothetical protein
MISESLLPRQLGAVSRVADRVGRGTCLPGARHTQKSGYLARAAPPAPGRLRYVDLAQHCGGAGPGVLPPPRPLMERAGHPCSRRSLAAGVPPAWGNEPPQGGEVPHGISGEGPPSRWQGSRVVVKRSPRRSHGGPQARLAGERPGRGSPGAMRLPCQGLPAGGPWAAAPRSSPVGRGR